MAFVDCLQPIAMTGLWCGTRTVIEGQRVGFPCSVMEGMHRFSAILVYIQFSDSFWSCERVMAYIVILQTNLPLCFVQLGNYASLEGVLYCKPHFDQLLKQTGSFDKSFDQQG